MKKTWYSLFVIGLCLISMAFIYGCGSNASGGGSGTSTVSNRTGTYSYAGTQASGDAWAWTISTSEFIATNETLDFTITGEWNTLVSGFGKAKVEGVFGGLGGPSVGGYAYFLEFPKTLLLVKPADSGESRVLVCAAAATAEPAGGQFLFVNIPKTDWEDTKPAFGTVEASKGPPWSFDITSYLLNGDFCSHETVSDLTYSNGIISKESGIPPLKIFMTPSGMFIADNGPGQGGFVGASDEGISTAEVPDILNYTYKGVRFIYYPPSGGNPSTGETEPITAHKDTTNPNALWAQSYDDVDAGTAHQGAGYVVITFEASAVPGFLRGYVSGKDEIGTHSEIIQCVVSQVGPDNKDKMRYLLFGIGSDESTAKVYNFLLIQSN